MSSFGSSLGRVTELKRLSEQGKEEKCIRLDSFAGDISSTDLSMAVDGLGDLYIMSGEDLYSIDGEGKFLSVLSVSRGIPIKLIVSSEGIACAVVQDIEKLFLYALDGRSGKTEKLFELKHSSVYNGDEAYSLYISDTEGLWGLPSLENPEPEPVIMWSECEIDLPGLRELFPLGGGCFICLDGSGVHRLVPASPEEIKHRTELTLALVSSYQATEGVFASMVSSFNLNSELARIKLLDYSQGGAVSRADAIKRLNVELIAGKGPDLIMFDEMPISPYTEKGVMADLYGFMDLDPDISRDDFVLLDKLAEDGKLFYAVPGFDLELVYGRYSDYGERLGWTIDEFTALQSSQPAGREVFPDVSREYFLERVLRLYLHDALDWASGTCDFENRDFISILNAAASIDPGIDTEPNYYEQCQRELAQGRRETCLSTAMWVYSIADDEREAGERLSIIGWPSVDGRFGTLAEADFPVGICQASRHKKEAWEFVKYMLIQKPICIPTYKKTLDENIDSAINRVAFSPDDPLIIDELGHAPWMSRQDADRLYELIDHIEFINEDNSQIMDIILEEAERFFDGISTAEETARVVNECVGLIMAEKS